MRSFAIKPHIANDLMTMITVGSKLSKRLVFVKSFVSLVRMQNKGNLCMYIAGGSAER